MVIETSFAYERNAYTMELLVEQYLINKNLKSILKKFQLRLIISNAFSLFEYIVLGQIKIYKGELCNDR